MQRSSLAVCLITLLAIGCEPSMIALPSSNASRPALKLSEDYDPSLCGTLEGTIHWAQSSIPIIPPINRPLSIVSHDQIPNPNALTLDADKNIAGAVVMIVGIDPRKSKPWDHPAVEVELTDRGISVQQGDYRGRVGFVRCGDAVKFRASGEKTLGYRVRGSEFFGNILTPNVPRMERTFNKSGILHITSASGQFWAAADLFLTDHPYFTRTNAAGKYRFENVPAGSYEVWAIHPNWEVDATETDPESSLVVRQRYKKAFEESRIVEILPKNTTTENIGLGQIR